MDLQVSVKIDFAERFYDFFGNAFKSKSMREEEVKGSLSPGEKIETANNQVKTAAIHADTSASNVVTIEVVRAKVSELVRAGRREEVSKILTKYGVTGYSQLQGEELQKFYNEVKEL